MQVLIVPFAIPIATLRTCISRQCCVPRFKQPIGELIMVSIIAIIYLGTIVGIFLPRLDKILNLEVVNISLGSGNKENEPRPKTAPQCVYRSPTHPNYKETEYLQSRILLRYDGPGEGVKDEVKVHQQPKGTYTLPVFKGLLSVGGLET